MSKRKEVHTISLDFCQSVNYNHTHSIFDLSTQRNQKVKPFCKKATHNLWLTGFSFLYFKYSAGTLKNTGGKKCSLLIKYCCAQLQIVSKCISSLTQINYVNLFTRREENQNLPFLSSHSAAHSKAVGRNSCRKNQHVQHQEALLVHKLSHFMVWNVTYMFLFTLKCFYLLWLLLLLMLCMYIIGCFYLSHFCEKLAPGQNRYILHLTYLSIH